MDEAGREESLDTGTGATGNVPVTHAGRSHEFRISLIVLRALLLALVVIALSLMVTDRETGKVQLPFFGLPKPVFVTRTARYDLITGLKFYVDALAVVLAYTFLHLLFNIGLVATKGSVVDRVPIAWVAFVADSLMAYLIICAAAVATEIGYLAEQGAPAVLWKKVCDSFGYFCTVYAISVVMSFLGALVSFVVVAISAYHLFRVYGIRHHQEATTRLQTKDTALQP